MTLPRPALLGILGAVLVIAVFVASHRPGKGAGSSSSAAAPAQATKPAPAPAHKAAPAPAHKAAPAATATPTSHSARHSAAKKPVQVKAPAGRAAGASMGLPLPVARAFADHRVVVIFFAGRGTDDKLTAASVRALRKSDRRVRVFMDKLSNLADYRRVVEGLDVSQAPSIVIVGPDHRAHLYEGFIDAGSLRQSVADVTR